MSSLKDSPFFAPFKEETSVWEDMLSTLSDRLTHVNAIQRKWLYLQPIFARGALPQEQPRFRRVDEDFQGIMASIDADSLVKSFAQTRMRPDHLNEMSTQLDLCQKALAEHPPPQLACPPSAAAGANCWRWRRPSSSTSCRRSRA